MFLLDWLTQKITRQRTDVFFEKWKTDELTLEIGCGDDRYGNFFPNRKTLDRAPRPGVHVDYVADAENMPEVASGSFPVVNCNAILEHTEHPEKVIAECFRVLKPGGLLFVSVPFVFPVHDAPKDYWRWTKYGLRYLMRDFQILELYEMTNTVETLGVLYQRIGFQCQTLKLRSLKVIWFVLAKLTLITSWIITKEHGDVSSRQPETNILCVGYHVAARKPLQ
jgi:predicted SAM-dependent methyltransferase